MGQPGLHDLHTYAGHAAQPPCTEGFPIQSVGCGDSGGAFVGGGGQRISEFGAHRCVSLPGKFGVASPSAANKCSLLMPKIEPIGSLQILLKNHGNMCFTQFEYRHKDRNNIPDRSGHGPPPPLHCSKHFNTLIFMFSHISHIIKYRGWG